MFKSGWGLIVMVVQIKRTVIPNVLETDANTYDCGNKKGFLGANLAVGLRDLGTKKYLVELLGQLLK